MLRLQEESDQSAAQRERHRLAKVRGTLARNERVRVLSREEACREAQYQRKEPVEAPDEPEASAFAQVVESEGIILDASGRSGLIGRRADGSLVRATLPLSSSFVPSGLQTRCSSRC